MCVCVCIHFIFNFEVAFCFTFCNFVSSVFWYLQESDPEDRLLIKQSAVKIGSDSEDSYDYKNDVVGVAV